MFVPHAGGAASRRADNRVVRALREAGATSEEAAVAFTPANGMEERALQRLLASGAVKPGRRDSYWLDLERLRELRHALMRLVAMILLVEAGIVLGLVLNLPHHHR